MIGKLSGRIDYRGEDHVLIDVRGVGYVVYCSDRTLAALPGVGEAVALYTDLLVREDLLQLFGFPSLLEKEWHRLLTSVQGIGAKASLAILGTLGAEGVSRAIALGDIAAIKAAKGIGPKTAQRVVHELKDKAPALMAMGGSLGDALEGAADLAVVEDEGEDEGAVLEPIEGSRTARRQGPAQASGKGGARAGGGKGAGKGAAAGGRGSAQAQADALSALSNLGYAPAEAAQAVAQAADEAGGAVEPQAIIRAALKLLAPKG